MQETIVVARKWGNSLGVTIPNNVAEKEKIMPNDRVVVSFRKAKSIESLFGTLKTKKTAQELKDEARKGWD
ncbi:MAG: AbrB/MazE/SpoVT family DNA-binding domain-containing protein [archaeon]